MTWNLVLTTLIEWSDDIKRADKDRQYVQLLINKNEKSKISLQRKRRKGQILKAIEREINPYLKQFYCRKQIRYAIAEINLKELDFELWQIAYNQKG